VKKSEHFQDLDDILRKERTWCGILRYFDSDVNAHVTLEGHRGTVECIM
jgi:hypothetical protein